MTPIQCFDSALQQIVAEIEQATLNTVCTIIHTCAFSNQILQRMQAYSQLSAEIGNLRLLQPYQAMYMLPMIIDQYKNGKHEITTTELVQASTRHWWHSKRRSRRC
jgi:hypothetical protein